MLPSLCFLAKDGRVQIRYRSAKIISMSSLADFGKYFLLR